MNTVSCVSYGYSKNGSRNWNTINEGIWGTKMILKQEETIEGIRVNRRILPSQFTVIDNYSVFDH